MGRTYALDKATKGSVKKTLVAENKAPNVEIIPGQKLGQPPGIPSTIDDGVVKPISFFQLFRFADGVDKVLMFFGTLCAVIQGFTLQLNFLILASVIDAFIEFDASTHQDSTGTTALYDNMTAVDSEDLAQKIADMVPDIVWKFSANATAVLITGYIHMTCWTMTAERQIRVIRDKAFRSVVKQHMAWFDRQQSGEINIRLTSDVVTVYNGMGDKVATSLQWVSAFFSGVVLCLYRGWELTLVILTVAPAIALVGGVSGKFLQKFARKEIAAYGQAGAVAEEVLSSIRIVTAYNGQEKESQRYDKQLSRARAVGMKRGYLSGGLQGLLWFLIFGIVALAFWYGNILIDQNKGYQGGMIIQVLFSLFSGMRSLSNAIANMETFTLAKSAGAAVFELIDLTSDIDSMDSGGMEPKSVEGSIRLDDVTFKYPTRQDYTVLTKFSLDIKRGQTVAIVGPSGSGKSTIIQLLQRFYDVTSGMIQLDGRDIRDLNVQWLRRQIGVVSQEPILFATTIEENIMFGCEKASAQQVVEAAKKANAHDFISKLPEGYKTMVGMKGTQLSGGQKQRIAIARALVQDPKILLLDDATSALDYQSEAVVQEALDHARTGRTTIIVAHRLSSVRNADIICCIDQGLIKEAGSHTELLQKGGLYARLAQKQPGKHEPTLEGLKEEPEDEGEYLEDLSTSPVDDTIMGALVDGPIGSPTSALDSIIGGFQRVDSRNSSFHSIQRARMRSRGSSVGHISNATRASLKRRYKAAKQQSVTSRSANEKSDVDVEHSVAIPPDTVRRVFKLNASEWPYMVIGCIGSVLQAAIWPLITFFMSDIMAAFAMPDRNEATDIINKFVLVEFGIGVMACIASFSMIGFFSASGEILTERMRSLSFKAMLRQEVGWFDDQRHQVGSLTSQLATDAATVKAATGSALSTALNAVTAMILSLTIAFIFGWKLSLVSLAFVPFLIGTGYAQAKLLVGFAAQSMDVVEEGGKMVSEVVDNMKTVASLTREQYFVDKFYNHFEGSFKEGKKRSFVFGVTWGLSSAIIYFAYAANYGFGAHLISIGEMSFEDVFRVFACIATSAIEFGRVNAFIADFSKAKVAAAKLFALYDRKPLIDPLEEGEELGECDGVVSFRGVRFRYPTRPEAPILQGLDLTIDAGKTLALVGPSGCGKSTTIQLLERYYDPEVGNVLLDGRDIRHSQVRSLRNHISLVAQEPSLFDATVRENIAYGDLSRDITMEEIIEASKMANIHDFVKELPQGYETNVGAKGIQLVGGQKQRIAIARALVGQPKILLLDEATSALDNENEKIVQEALDRARQGRTCIVIAHRLSTIEDADVIAVIESGRVAEIGRHHELMALGGLYYQLQQIQMGAQ